jgi:hypothetical protein
VALPANMIGAADRNRNWTKANRLPSGLTVKSGPSREAGLHFAARECAASGVRSPGRARRSRWFGSPRPVLPDWLRPRGTRPRSRAAPTLPRRLLSRISRWNPGAPDAACNPGLRVGPRLRGCGLTRFVSQSYHGSVVRFSVG